MKITLYFINWNDAFYLPFIKKHYGKFCHRIVMYDNHSTDNSQELAESLGFEVRTFGLKGILDDHQYLLIKNHCWKEERGKSDFVIVCDADEFIVPMNLIKGSNPVVTGYNMISNHLPVDDIFEVKTGSYSENYSKQAIFCPEIEEINFVHGCHKNHIKSDLRIRGDAKIYHFRQIGGVQRLIQRHSEYRTRISQFNLKHGMGVHYGRPDWTQEEIKNFNNQKVLEWNSLESQTVVLL
jgi:Glycosyl transferase family 2